MNTSLKKAIFLIAAALLFFSCDNLEITTKGTITGTISDYTKNSIDKIKCVNLREGELLGESQVTSTGKFSMTLTTPDFDEIGVYEDYDISDPTAKTGSGIIYAYKNNTKIGSLYRSKIKIDRSNLSVGDVYTEYIHSDKPVTIKGSSTVLGITVIFDVDIKKGWNEYGVEIIENNSSNITIKCTSKIPSGLKWEFYPTSSKVKQSIINNQLSSIIEKGFIIKPIK